MTDQTWRLGAAQTAAAIRSGDLSAAAALESHIARMDAQNGPINAVVVDLRDEARETAAAADAEAARARSEGRSLPPLHGVPILVKENVDFKGRANLNGVEANRKYIAPDDSPVVRNLRNAGAIPFGLTNTPEFSMRVVTDNPVHGETLNPWDHARSAGGSSGGSAAATAAGIGCMGHGNDIGGSVRIPAAACGLSTIRATLGRIPAFNPSAPAERPLVAQLMSVQGPMCRSVEDVALCLQAMSAPDPRDPWQVPAPLFDWPEAPRPLRVAVARHPEDYAADPAILAKVDEAARMLADAGHTLVEVDLPDPKADWQLWADLLINEMRIMAGDAMLPVVSDDFKTVWEGYLGFTNRTDDAKEMLTLMAERSARLRRWQVLLSTECDVVLTPALASGAPMSNGDIADLSSPQNVWGQSMLWIPIFNLLGLPAAVTPAGMVDGLPVGVQIVAARYREDRALRAAADIEARVGPVLPALWDRLG
ncbi:amidase [Rhodovulum sp. DZ06]|uniref:amidase n=1 Tax=Rhodovulum sp. DZ06 TaxID=3425126 RepID=UPI003D353EE1